MKPHVYVGMRFVHEGRAAEIVRVIGWYVQAGATGSHGTDRVDGVIVNLHLPNEGRFIGHVCLSHAFCRWQLAKRVRGEAA